MPLVLGEMDIAWINPHWSGPRVNTQCTWPGLHPTGQQQSPNSRGDLRSATYVVDDVHQVQITLGIWGGIQRTKGGIGVRKART